MDFFQKETFNRLSEKAINQLKEKIDELGILKTENLSEYIQVTILWHIVVYIGREHLFKMNHELTACRLSVLEYALKWRNAHTGAGKRVLTLDNKYLGYLSNVLPRVTTYNIYAWYPYGKCVILIDLHLQENLKNLPKLGLAKISRIC